MSAKCFDCKVEYGSTRFPDMIVPSYIWIQISPTGNRGGLLCPNCIVARCAAHDLTNVPHFFASGPLCMPTEPSWALTEVVMEMRDDIEDICSQLSAVQEKTG